MTLTQNQKTYLVLVAVMLVVTIGSLIGGQLRQHRLGASTNIGDAILHVSAGASDHGTYWNE